MTDAIKPRIRALRSDVGKKRVSDGKVAIELSLRPDLLDHARQLVRAGEFRSVSEYVDSLLTRDEIARRML